MALANFSCECVTVCPVGSGSATPTGGRAFSGGAMPVEGTPGLAPSDYLQTLQDLLPSGRAWTRDPAAELTALLEALSYEPGRVDMRSAQLLLEADPSTATELLPDWLRVTGLTAATAGMTPAQQQAAIVAKLTAGGGASIAFVTQLAETLGYTITITEYLNPFRFGVSRFKTSLYQYPWNFRWDVVTVTGAMDSLLKSLIRSLAPAHTLVTFNI